MNRNSLVLRGKCLIQQGLANRNPDVDAIFRLVCSPGRLSSTAARLSVWPAVVGGPFQRPRTRPFFNRRFHWLYLPTFCSFRMTDIWRSFVAQRCLWEMESAVCFTETDRFIRSATSTICLRDFEGRNSGLLEERSDSWLAGKS